VLTTDTAAASIHFHVVTGLKQTAHDAGLVFADIVDQSWVTGPVSVWPTAAQGVFMVSMKVNAPRFEISTDAPLLARALLAAQHVAPCDTLRANLLKKGDRGYLG
jgi:hypothetical protein